MVQLYENQPVNRVVAIGTIESITSQVEAGESSFLFKTLTKAGVTPNAALLKHVVARLAPGNDNGDSSSLLLPQGQSFATVSLCALPKQVSRANALARPHAIATFVKAHNSLVKTSDQDEDKDDALKNQVVLVALMLPEHDATWYAAGCAVARAAPLFVDKEKKKSGVLADDQQEEPQVTPDHLAVVYETPLKPEELTLLKASWQSIQLCARLVDTPADLLHPDNFVQEALRVAKRTGATPTIIRGKDLHQKGLGGIYGVGRAAKHEPALVVLSHVPAGAAKDAKSVVLVGKGIMYDTGGLSLKTGGIMVGMKRDMGGAAGVLGAFEAAVLGKNTTSPLHVVLCVAENAIGPLAIRPDDILHMYSGKTVEINNTDAEGRLVLADGCAYAVKHLNPKVLLDMATLTGAQGVTSGDKIGSFYCNDETLEQCAIKAGKCSGDLVHPMPYAPEFFRGEFKSTVADMKNSVKNRANGQSACAAQFVGNHLGEYETKGRWIHLDMAYPVKTDADERATGYGVAFVQCLLKQVAANSL